MVENSEQYLTKHQRESSDSDGSHISSQDSDPSVPPPGELKHSDSLTLLTQVRIVSAALLSPTKPPAPSYLLNLAFCRAIRTWTIVYTRRWKRYSWPILKVILIRLVLRRIVLRVQVSHLLTISWLINRKPKGRTWLWWILRISDPNANSRDSNISFGLHSPDNVVSAEQQQNAQVRIWGDSPYSQVNADFLRCLDG